MTILNTTYDQINLKYLTAAQVYAELYVAFSKYGKENVQFEVEIDGGYGDAYAICYLKCRREMTAEEMVVAEKKNKIKVMQQRKWDLKQLEQLKKKYENV